MRPTTTYPGAVEGGRVVDDLQPGGVRQRVRKRSTPPTEVPGVSPSSSVPR
jgi:hypothetical protein